MSIFTRRDLLRSSAYSSLGISASPFLTRSAWARAALLAATSDAAQPAILPREKLLFDFGWKFTLGNGTDPAKDLGFGNGQGDFAKTGDFQFAKVPFDDAKWGTVSLPHDWAVELPFVH